VKIVINTTDGNSMTAENVGTTHGGEGGYEFDIHTSSTEYEHVIMPWSQIVTVIEYRETPHIETGRKRRRHRKD
jgi:hypothetical protein